MSEVNSNVKKLWQFVREKWFIFFAVFIYLFFSVYYMGVNTTVLDCGNSLNGLGDNAAGPIWKSANVGDAPVGGYSSATNYPTGESMSSPIDLVVIGQSVIFWSLSKVVGPVCGYNVANVIGYMSASLVMFALVYSLTKGRRWIALLAGYAVAFTPFFQAKSGGHPSYGFQAILIGIVWAFFSFATTRKLSRGLILAALVALCFYFDPYFSLLAGTIVGPLTIVWLIISFMRSRNDQAQRKVFFKQLKYVGISLALLVALLAPLAYTIKTQSSAIDSAVAGTRDDIFFAARVYSNLPSEYLLPFQESPFFGIFGSYEQDVRKSLYVFSDGNVSEDSVGLSLIAVAVIVLFAIVASWEKIQGRKPGLDKLIGYDPKLVIGGSVAIAVLAMLLAAPPVHVLGIPLPSHILIEYTTIWRVLSREYVAVNIAVIVLFAVAMAYFAGTLKRVRPTTKRLLYGLVFVLILVQYQAYAPFQGVLQASFNYRNAPAGYQWLATQKDITAVAEYPLQKATEANAHGYFLAMQIVHKKPLLNSAIQTSPGDGVRSSIKSLTDPQTVPILHSLGINAVILHGVKADDVEKVPYLDVVYKGPHGDDAGLPGSTAIESGYDLMVIAKIADNTPYMDSSLQFITVMPPNSSIQTSSLNWQYEVPTGITMTKRALPRNHIPASVPKSDVSDVCFTARMAEPGDTGKLTLKSPGGVDVSADLNDAYQPLKLSVKNDDIITIASDNGHNMRMTQLGCQGESQQ